MHTETTDTDTAPTGPVSHSQLPPQHGRRAGRRTLIALASASLVVGSISFATNVAANEDFENRCTPTSQGSADSLERQALACQAELDDAYVACMRTVARTPDSAERWVDYCQTQALG